MTLREPMMETRTFRFRNDSKIASAVAQAVPAPRSLPVPSVRLREAQRAVLTKGIITVFSVLGWSEGTLEVVHSPAPARRRGRPVGSSEEGHGSSALSVVSADGRITYVVRSKRKGPPHPLGVKEVLGDRVRPREWT